MKRDLLTLDDISLVELESIFKRAGEFKDGYLNETGDPALKGKSIGLIFEKSSTRTRVSFEVGINKLGGHSIFLSSRDIQLGRGESITDTARVLSSYMDGLVIRTFAHDAIEEWARNASVPVINGLTDLHHPCQVISDLFTIKEKKGRFSGLKLAYIGDGNNVAHSLIEGASRVGINISLASPKGYEPSDEIIRKAKEDAARNGSFIEVTNNPLDAAESADIIYADVWTSMGQEDDHEERLKAFKGFQVDQDLIKRGNPYLLVMHCLPAHRGEEITDTVIDGKNSIVFEQAENRLYVQMAILEMLI
ncbi:MAG TPA: ornithine carbamoyltransferase [Nitrospiria bacterium]|nr:ornithine carbamoyltransferase [Nitrospiria bacterium]